jgi:hypothetical protein
VTFPAAVTYNRQVLKRVILGVCLSVAFIAFAYPMYVIRPFRAQGPTELAVALAVRNWGSYVAIVAAIIAVLVGFRKRVLPVIAALLTVAFAVMANINVFEIMFHRIESPEIARASEAKLDSDDMVLAIGAGGESRAYPVRMLAYHHIVNDRLGDLPVVSTY